MSTNERRPMDDLIAPTVERYGDAAPRCRMCARSARWLSTQLHYAAYCAGKACSSRERLCQRQGCGRPFVLGVDGAGTKYCSTGCKALAYHPTREDAIVRCAWCDRPNSAPYVGPRYKNRVWPYICATCLDPIKHVVDRLKAHHVPHERARLLRDNPGCEVCGTDLLAKTRGSGHGKLKADLVVDHDHSCCPVESNSCGQCIRGLVCRHCNIALGMLKDDIDNARSLVSYLELWFSRR